MLEPFRLDWVESNLAQGKANSTLGAPSTYRENIHVYLYHVMVRVSFLCLFNQFFGRFVKKCQPMNVTSCDDG